MDKLWAPWRIGYVSNAAKDDRCFLCTAGHGNDDAQALVVRRGKHVFAVLNRFPYNNGHVMVAPYAHKADLPDLAEAERAELMNMVIEVQAAARATLRPQGFNIGLNIGAAAGAGIPAHLHVHVVPRWVGDTSFMPALTDVKVISQSLEEARKVLAAYFERETHTA